MDILYGNYVFVSCSHKFVNEWYQTLSINHLLIAFTFRDDFANKFKFRI